MLPLHRRAFYFYFSLFAAFALVAVGLAACAGEEPFGGQPPEAAATFHGTVDTLTDADTILTTDLLGSVLGEATGSGNSTGRFATYPFGRARRDGSTELRKYAGAPRDAVGLDAMGARYFAPDLGVWTSGDPVAVMAPERLVTADFAAANPYAYAKDSPLLAADRNGHFWHVAAGAAFGALIGGAVEAGRQYLSTGKVEDWGRVGAAAGGGAVAGALTAANPIAGLGSAIGMGAASSTLDGVTRRLIVSGGHSAGSFHEAVVDASVGAVTGGLVHGGTALVKTAIAKAPSAARAVASRVASLADATTKVGTTTVYRAVSAAELVDVNATGRLRAGANALGNKWFAETPRDAAAWGKAFYQIDREPFFTLKVDIPSSVADQMARVPHLDGIGPARQAEGAVLDLVNEHGTFQVLGGNVVP